MAKREIYKVFTDLPRGIQQFLLGEVEDFYEKLEEDFKLPEDQFYDGFDAQVVDSIMGAISFDQAMAKIGEYLNSAGLDGEKQRQIITLLLQKVYWPIRELFGKILTDFVSQQKIDTASWPQKRILFKPLSYTGAVSEVINRLGLHSAGQQTRDKMRDILVSMVNGTRVPSQAKEVMLRPVETGGLGFDAKMADQALAVLDELIKSVKIMSEDEYRSYLAAEIAQTLNVAPGAIGTEVEDKQIATIKAAMPAPPRAVSELDKAIVAIYDKIPEKPEDPYLQNRLRNVISSRLRDVRSSIELLSLLQRDSKVGGMGLEREPAEAWAKIVEEAYTEFHGKIESEEKNKLDLQLVEQKQKIEEHRKREAEEHAQWYEEKIKKRQSAETERQQLAAAFKKGLEAKAVHPLDIKNRLLEKKQFGELVPATPTSAQAAGVKLEPPPKPLGPSAAQKMPPTPIKAPTVKISAVTAALAQVPRPVTVDGVQPVAGPKLHGLVEELGNMSLSSFRRLGKTPREATAKIKQRLETLGQEAFDHKVTGIRTWQGSPVMRMYMALAAESFTLGKPIAETAEAKRKAGVDTLTRDEIEALIELNNELHF